jgi:hypothetical protein
MNALLNEIKSKFGSLELSFRHSKRVSVIHIRNAHSMPLIADLLEIIAKHGFSYSANFEKLAARLVEVRIKNES